MTPPARRRAVSGEALVAILVVGCCAGRLEASDRIPIVGRPPLLRASGRFFTDPEGRVVILRGVNVANDSKVPPFRPISDPSQLDVLASQGMNIVRLLFIWEAFEPRPGQYDDAYLDYLRSVAEAAWERGLYVIIDVHQDGFARGLARGCGGGFPPWAISPRSRSRAPDNGCGCKNWVFHEVTDPNVHRSFADFYADAYGVRTRYLAMLDRIAGAFATVPGVIGYDPLNEPWGDESKELAPLYRDAAEALRARHPSAILFLAGHATTGNGKQTRMPRPAIANFAYSPHYYTALVVIRNAWHGGTSAVDRGFATMRAKAEEWDVPLFVGEFGIHADAGRAGDYISLLYDRLDLGLGSAAQWNYTPHWNHRDGDGWNGENYNILDATGAPRPNYRPRPYPRKIAGVPILLRYHEAAPGRGGPCLEFAWQNRPERGETELFVPNAIFPPGSTLDVRPADVSWRRDEVGQRLFLRTGRAETVRVILSSPPPPWNDR